MFLMHLILLVPLVTLLRESDGLQSEGVTKPFKNLYGTEEFSSRPVENIVGAAMGAAQFLIDSAFQRTNSTIDMTPDTDSTYDFIVIGAGTSGATLASRLSEIDSTKILLIEAGPEEEMIMDVPITVGYLQPLDDINWKYKTEPSDNYCIGMNNQQCNWPRGKVMGGSSVLNFMIATRGAPGDFDAWAAQGNKGWAYKDVLKYFKKLENIQVPKLRKDTEYRGTKGPVKISHSFHTPIANAFLKAGKEMGYQIIDYNGKNMIGFSHIQSTTHKGFRMSSNKAYLMGKQRANLDVTKNSMVHKILFDQKKKRAIGVLFKKNNNLIKVYARKEVLLCAGAVSSPQLLMLSGIGPAEHLREFGIKVIKDAPVGNNLMDHIAYGGLTFTIDQPASILTNELVDISRPYVKDYLLYGYGPLTVPGACETVAFLDVDDRKRRTGIPNIELLLLSSSAYGSPVIRYNLGLNSRIQNMFTDLESQHAWSVFPMLLKPKSRGWVRLASKDPAMKPRIMPNYMNDTDDQRLLVKGIRVAIEMSKTKALRQFGTAIYNSTLPGCENLEYDSDEYWLCQTRVNTMNIYHYSGTCKMGPANDSSAVVDPRLKVIGVKGLRVVDASIMPDIVAAHTNIPSHMIGEKAADMIKEDWGYPTDPL